jgi:hypothetical protein
MDGKSSDQRHHQLSNQYAIGESLEHLQNMHLRNRVEESTITSKVAFLFPNFVMLLK